MSILPPSDKIEENLQSHQRSQGRSSLTNELNQAQILIDYLKSRYIGGSLHLTPRPSTVGSKIYDVCTISNTKSKISYDREPTQNIEIERQREGGVPPPKISLSRKIKKDVSDAQTYVNEKLIRLEFDNEIKKKESLYDECTDEVRDSLLKIFETSHITLKNLIEWGDLYHQKQIKSCGQIDLKCLFHLQKPLKNLDAMIGLGKLKENIVEQILMCLQGLHQSHNDSTELYHTVIYGPPGVGKTQLAKILAHIYIVAGLIYKRKIDLSHFDIEDHFETASRSELIGMYCGHTAVQTQKIIDKCRKYGKVLFIDETYSLGGDRSDRDNFSKECIDTINKNLTEGAGEFICIIAGYPEDIKKCFFSYNRGLERRFNCRYTIDKYSPDELRSIFLQKLEECNWTIDSKDTIPVSLFKTNQEYFPNYGGDIVTFLQKCKICHAKRVFGKIDKELKQLSKSDIIQGLEMYKKDKNEIDKNIHLQHIMYT